MQNPSLTPNLTGITLSAAERQMGPISGGPINFAFARLSHASLRFATLSGANLEMADLTDADLSDARLDGANLSGAEFGDAVLERVDFAGANFSGANLKEARNLTQTQIDEALGDSLTVLPPHLARPEGWGGAAQTVSDLLGRNGKHQDPANGKAPQAPGATTSWLVGGPRTTLMTRAG